VRYGEYPGQSFGRSESDQRVGVPAARQLEDTAYLADA
jgi:hypothetical protein